MVKFIPSHKYLEGERPNFACRVIWFQRPSSFHIAKGTPDSNNERFLRRGATERRPLKRTVSFTGQPPLAPLVCVCVGKQSIPVIQRAIIPFLWSIQGHLLLCLFNHLFSCSCELCQGRGQRQNANPLLT